MRALRVWLSLFLLWVTACWAEPVKVWISLSDKGPGLAKSSMSERAYENAPVYKPYLDQLRAAGFGVAVTLKWQNRVSGWAEPSALDAIVDLPFVLNIEEMPRKASYPPSPAEPAKPTALPKSFVQSRNSVRDTLAIDSLFGAFREIFDSVGANVLADTIVSHNLPPGAGLKIAVIDEDFYLGHDAFDSLFARNGIIDQWNFVDNVAQAAFPSLRSNSHGAWVLSLLTANLPGIAVGLAPHAQYLLYRTENGASETYVEEDYLAAALERAVDSGAQVINISLGYRYDIDGNLETPYSEMDGRTRPSTLAALGAARRGALVVVAIGNEDGVDGNGNPTITAPADADSILTVGIQQSGNNRCFYSSTGPTFDGRLKPEIVSVGLGAACGVYVIDPNTAQGIQVMGGTSFAAPVLAGIGALLRQLHPDSLESTQRIRQALMATGRGARTPDNLVGNGLVRAAQAHCALLRDSMVQYPCGGTPVAVKGVLVWRGGNLNTLTWTTGLDLNRTRMWDLQGRTYPVRGTWGEEGEILLKSNRELAPGTFILRIPKLSE